VSDVEPRLLVNPFSHLEELFIQTTLAQMTLEKASFDFLSIMLLDCLKTYLKPIRKWMENGELGANDETFFVFENDSGSDVASMWHDRFVLRRDAQNQLRSPSFLQPAAMKIFNTGKSVIFLKELGYGHTLSANHDNEPSLDHSIVCGTSDDVPLSPFQELFHAGFERWIRSKYSLASASLRTHIFEAQGLMRILNTFQMLFLGSNGAVFENFANAVFERMDSGHRGWSDRYMLTELARSIFSDVLHTQDAEKIVVRSTKTKDQGRSVKGLAAVSVDYSVSCNSSHVVLLLTTVFSYTGPYSTLFNAPPCQFTNNSTLLSSKPTVPNISSNALAPHAPTGSSTPCTSFTSSNTASLGSSTSCAPTTLRTSSHSQAEIWKLQWRRLKI
jgi:gamma-tubulin complex component 5